MLFGTYDINEVIHDNKMIFPLLKKINEKNNQQNRIVCIEHINDNHTSVVLERPIYGDHSISENIDKFILNKETMDLDIISKNDAKLNWFSRCMIKLNPFCYLNQSLSFMINPSHLNF